MKNIDQPKKALLLEL